ncbi:MAG TPA: nitroreductase/quinone reductase family protein [Mycobacteriales bacterium]|nr:nitroreductase/quinone reductase family protein [Mycobacteriales bacterium]
MAEDARNRYVRPSGFDTFFNRLVGLFTKAGISVMGSRVLAVKGRSSGVWRTTPVNLLTVDGVRHLVAPRGQAQWVRNIRVAGGGELRLGRRIEPITVIELADADKPPVIRAYLERWGWEVGKFFDGLTKDATDEQILAVAPGFPVFRLT